MGIYSRSGQWRMSWWVILSARGPTEVQCMSFEEGFPQGKVSRELSALGCIWENLILLVDPSSLAGMGLQIAMAGYTLRPFANPSRVDPSCWSTWKRSIKRVSPVALVGGTRPWTIWTRRRERRWDIRGRRRLSAPRPLAAHTVATSRQPRASAPLAVAVASGDVGQGGSGVFGRPLDGGALP